MKNLLNIEVYQIETTEEGSFAHISYQDPNWKGDDPTNGFDHVKVPLKLRMLIFQKNKFKLILRNV